MTKKAAEVRIWKGGPARLMVEAEGYVMARRKGCAPFVVSAKEWKSLPLAGPGAGDDISSRLLKPAL